MHLLMKFAIFKALWYLKLYLKHTNPTLLTAWDCVDCLSDVLPSSPSPPAAAVRCRDPLASAPTAVAALPLPSLPWAPPSVRAVR